jgi:EAL domain-containing protein (putative c-di-GMP-specific phosphodiesterase class I)
MLASIVDLAHGLDLSVVAEGVETSRQLTDITELGADQAQGHYLCPPLPREEIDQRVLEPASRTPIRFPLEPATTTT